MQSGLRCATAAFDMTFCAYTSDVYGEAFSRDIEPSVDAGTRLYDIMASCLKLFRAGVRACTDALVQEACCAGKVSCRFSVLQLLMAALSRCPLRMCTW